MTNNRSRREFLKRGALSLTILPIAQQLLSGERVYAQALPTKALDPSAPNAQALGYVHDAKQVDVSKWPKRNAPGGETQFCDNCMFWQQGGLKAEGREGEWGKCLIFPDGLVAAKGWCNSWAPKPA